MTSPAEQPLILASGSAARARIMRAAGLSFESLPVAVDEESIREAMEAESAPPRDVADALAALKAMRGSTRIPQAMVIGADQILVCDGRIFGKPADMATAKAQLMALRGKTHELISAAAAASNSAVVWRHVTTARMTMRPFSEAFVDDYLERCGDGILGSVGAYHYEGLGAQLFARVSGDYFTIMGLPLLELMGWLRARGALKE